MPGQVRASSPLAARLTSIPVLWTSSLSSSRLDSVSSTQRMCQGRDASSWSVPAALVFRGQIASTVECAGWPRPGYGGPVACSGSHRHGAAVARREGREAGVDHQQRWTAEPCQSCPPAARASSCSSSADRPINASSALPTSTSSISRGWPPQRDTRWRRAWRVVTCGSRITTPAPSRSTSRGRSRLPLLLKGNVKEKVEPWSGTLSTSISPPICSTSWRQMARPSQCRRSGVDG